MVKYVNSIGQEIDLMSDYIRIKEASLSEYEWGYEGKDDTYGMLITRFKRDVAQYPITLIFRGTEQQKKQNLNDFFEKTEIDVLRKSPGKLMYNDYYLNCYIVSSSTHPGDYFDTEREITVIAPYPFWQMERVFSFGIQQSSAAGTFLDYPHDYNYDYAPEGRNDYVNNDHYGSCDFIMNIFGPAINPEIMIAGHVYEVITTLESGEYLQINSREGTVVKVSQTGEMTNEYNNRNKTSSVFEKIPPGDSLVSWDGNFGFDITLFVERSEPKWIT